MSSRKSSGSALTAREIEALSDPDLPETERLIGGLIPGNLKGAAYDLRMAPTGMVLPDGRVIRPEDAACNSSVLLEPGQTILVSTLEQLHVPNDLTGNISIKGALAAQGVLPLTGLVVDPGYDGGANGDGRLHIRLANLGSRAVLLQPGETRIISIQFLRLAQATDVPPGRSFDDIWQRVDELKEGLGFIEDLRELQKTTRALATEAERQRRTVNYVVVAGLFVVLATLLGVAVSGLLSLGNDGALVRAAHAIVPNDRGSQVFGAVSLFGVAAILAAVLSPFRVGRDDRRSYELSARYNRSEALRELRVGRARRVALATSLGTLTITAAVLLAAEGVVPWYGAAIGLTSVAIVLLLFDRHLVWYPIPQWKVDELVRTWEAEALKRGQASRV